MISLWQCGNLSFIRCGDIVFRLVGISQWEGTWGDSKSGRQGKRAKKCESNPFTRIFFDAHRGLCIQKIFRPGRLDRAQIVTRTSQNQFHMAEFDRWAEPLEDTFSRVLAENLSVLLSTENVHVFPWKKSTAIDYQVAVNVISFDGKLGESASLTARWTLFGKGGDEILAQRRSTFVESTGEQGYEALVIAESRALESLSREIASAIQEMSGRKSDE